MQNFQTKYIEERRSITYRRRSHIPVTEYIEKTLNYYNFVGVTERFNEGLVILKYMLNCSFADLLYVRSKDSSMSQSGTKPYKHLNEMSDTVKEYLHTTWTVNNEDDMVLWNMANKQLDGHIQKYTHFTRDLQYYETHLKRAQEICAVDYRYCYWGDNGCSTKCLNRYAMQHMSHQTEWPPFGRY